MKKVKIRILLIFVFALFVSNQIFSQKQLYKWSNELELLKRVDLLPAYRSNQLIAETK